MIKHVIVNSKTIDILAVLMLMSTIMLVGTSRLRASIWAYAIRSFLLALVSGLIAYFFWYLPYLSLIQGFLWYSK